MPYSAANFLPLAGSRLLTDTISTPSIFFSALACTAASAPVPARQIFISVFDETRRIRDRHRADLVGRKPAVEKLLREHRESFRHRRIDGLAEVGRDHRARDAGLANV